MPDGDGGCSFIKRKAEETPSHNRRASVGSWGLALASPDNMSAIACIGVPRRDTRARRASHGRDPRRPRDRRPSSSRRAVPARRRRRLDFAERRARVVAKRSLRGTSAPFVAHRRARRCDEDERGRSGSRRARGRRGGREEAGARADLVAEKYLLVLVRAFDIPPASDYGLEGLKRPRYARERRDVLTPSSLPPSYSLADVRQDRHRRRRRRAGARVSMCVASRRVDRFSSSRFKTPPPPPRASALAVRSAFSPSPSRIL